MQTTRRELLLGFGKLLIVLPAGAALLSCAGYGGGDGECAGTDQVRSTSTGLTVTSSCEFDHTHDFTIASADLAAPPQTGAGGATTADPKDGHVHTVTLTEGEVASIAAGQTVTKTSSNDASHTHTFRFRTA